MNKKERRVLNKILLPGYGCYPWAPCQKPSDCDDCEAIEECFREMKRKEKENMALWQTTINECLQALRKNGGLRIAKRYKGSSTK